MKKLIEAYIQYYKSKFDKPEKKLIGFVLIVLLIVVPILTFSAEDLVFMSFIYVAFILMTFAIFYVEEIYLKR